MKVTEARWNDHVQLQAENGETFLIKEGDFLNLRSHDGIKLNGKVKDIQSDRFELTSASWAWFGSVPYSAIAEVWNIH